MSSSIGTLGPSTLGGLGTFGSGSMAGGAGAKRWMVPGWCGCCTCTYFLDKFTRDDNSDLGANWTESAGSWAIDDYRLETTSSSGFCQCDVEGDDDEHVVSASVRGMSVGDQARLISSKILTEDSYWFFEVTWQATTATLELYQHVDGGGDTQRGSTTTLYNMAPGIPLHLRICFDDSTIAAQYRRDTGDIFTTATSYAAGATDSTCGVGTGTVNGEVRFDDFRLERHGTLYPQCPTCAPDCYVCSGAMPDEFLIVPTGDLDSLGLVAKRLAPVGGYVVRRDLIRPCYYTFDLDPPVPLYPDNPAWADRVAYRITLGFVQLLAGKSSAQLFIRSTVHPPVYAEWSKAELSTNICAELSAEDGWIAPFGTVAFFGIDWEVTAL